MIDVLDMLDADVDAALLERQIGGLTALRLMIKQQKRGNLRQEDDTRDNSDKDLSSPTEATTNADHQIDVRRIAHERISKTMNNDEVERSNKNELAKRFNVPLRDETLSLQDISTRKRIQQQEHENLRMRLEQAGQTIALVRQGQSIFPSDKEREQGYIEGFSALERVVNTQGGFSSSASYALGALNRADAAEQSLGMKQIDRGFERDARRYDGGEGL